MNKTKLIIRSLLLMFLLWAVNALVLKWPVHFQGSSGHSDHGISTRYGIAAPSRADVRVNGAATPMGDKQELGWGQNYPSEKVRQLSVD